MVSAGFWILSCSLHDPAVSTLPPCTGSSRRFPRGTCNLAWVTRLASALALSF